MPTPPPPILLFFHRWCRSRRSILGPEQGLAPPRPTRSKPLSAYPLTTRRPPVASCGVEEAREVMERAREHAHTAAAAPGAPLEKSGGGDDDGGAGSGTVGDGANVLSGGDGGGGNGGAGAGAAVVAEGIRSLIRATWEDVKDWCDEEAEARVRRKDAQVRAAA